jgi:large subunit ribosomal protein L28
MFRGNADRGALIAVSGIFDASKKDRQTRCASTDGCLGPAGTGIIVLSNYQGDFCLMAQICDVCGRGPQFGNRISHAHNVTKRRWNLNLQSVRALINGAGRRIRVCTSCIRSGKVQKVA